MRASSWNDSGPERVLTSVALSHPFRWRVLLASLLALAVPATAADLLPTVEDAYAARHLRRTPFEPHRAEGVRTEEARFLADLFALTDEAVLLNTDVGRWFASEGSRGLHAADYLERVDDVSTRMKALPAPARVVSARDLVVGALRLQRRFVAEWSKALDEGRAFESQLTHEFAYHEGLHRSGRLLLKAHAELRGLFPYAGEEVQTAFHDHLRAVSFQ
jgi:hypothetical protein